MVVRRNVGLVNAGLWLPPDQIKETLGEARGERLINDLGTGPDRVFDLIKTYEIQCDARRMEPCTWPIQVGQYLICARENNGEAAPRL